MSHECESSKRFQKVDLVKNNCLTSKYQILDMDLSEALQAFTSFKKGFGEKKTYGDHCPNLISTRFAVR